MGDVASVAMVIVFFALAAAYVRACAAVVGPGPSADPDEDGSDEELAA